MLELTWKEFGGVRMEARAGHLLKAKTVGGALTAVAVGGAAQKDPKTGRNLNKKKEIHLN